MLFRLSRVSFWLAAAVAALALLVPGRHATALTTVALAASMLAFGLWRSAVRTQQRDHHALSAVPEPILLTGAALQAVAATLVRLADEATTFEAALHAAAKLLRGELGARQVKVCELAGVDATHVQVVDLIESQPGFRALPRRVRLDGTALGEAVRSQCEVNASPAAIVLPVLAGTEVTALIELIGIEVPVDPEALAGLLERARVALSRRAQGLALAPPTPAAAASDLPRARAGIPAELSGRLGCRAASTSGMLEAAEALPRTQFDLVSGFDDHVSKPFHQDHMHRLLKRRLRLCAPVDSRESAASGSANAYPVLDPAALARLTELDPGGESRLLERVLQAFQASVARLRPQADLARQQGDRAGLRLVAHTLKSSSASIGAMHLSQLCAQIETSIRLESGDDLGVQLDALGTALDGALLAIAQLLKERA